ncbi:hypothetical protein GLYMA_08G065650v4 [Glycine max]|nr:hypothetical protein GLYMA_08G065650v4 [Glycine max]
MGVFFLASWSFSIGIGMCPSNLLVEKPIQWSILWRH